jgi:uncharacterized membrane protein
MKNARSYILIISAVFILAMPLEANATGWEQVSSHSYIDSNNCIVIISTYEYHLFGITWPTRT